MRSPNQKNWTNPELLEQIGPQITEFEQVVRELKLKPEDYANSTALREWVRENKNSKYVPPDLLRLWGFTVRAEV